MKVETHEVKKLVVSLLIDMDEASLLYRIMHEATDVDYLGKAFQDFRVELMQRLERVME